MLMRREQSKEITLMTLGNNIDCYGQVTARIGDKEITIEGCGTGDCFKMVIDLENQKIILDRKEREIIDI